MQPYISEPFAAIQTVIDTSKDTKERVHAAIGILDYGYLMFAPGPVMFGADKSEDELCEELKAYAAPMAVEAFPWEIVLPLVVSLLKKWLKF